MIRLTIAATCLVLAVNAQAATVTIDFENVTSENVDEVVSAQGFNFSNLNNHPGPGGPQVQVAGGVLAVDSIYVSWDGGVGFSAVDFSQTGSIPFDLHSIWLQYDYAYPVDLSVRGEKADGTSISLSFSNNFTFGSTVNFGAEWINLTSATIAVINSNSRDWDHDLYVDNIVVSTVPVPAALWLFASGLGLLGWLRRRPAA